MTTSWDGICAQLLQRYAIKADVAILRRSYLSSRGGGSEAAAESGVSVSDLYQYILHSHLPDLCTAPGTLPRNVGSLPVATLEAPAFVQVLTSRDATQPLRPCADMNDDEVQLLGAAQKATSHRLLKLTVTDGVVEVPAVELSTLRVFRGIPTPGEKLLLKSGTEVRNGMIILTDAHVEVLGGSETKLQNEFLLRKQRYGMTTSSTVHGLEGAPKFVPLETVHRVKLTASSGTPPAAPVGAASSTRLHAAAPPQHPHHSHGRGGPSHHHAGHHPVAAPGGRGGRGNQHHHQHTSRGGAGNERRVGRGAAESGAPHHSGHHQRHRDPIHTTAPAAAAPSHPQFSDEDFPPLGGSW